MSFDKMFTYLHTDIYTTHADELDTENNPGNTHNTCSAPTDSDCTEPDILMETNNTTNQQLDAWQWPPNLEYSSSSDYSSESNSMCSSLSSDTDEELSKVFSLLCIASNKVKQNNNHLRKLVLNKQCFNNIISYIESNIYV